MATATSRRGPMRWPKTAAENRSTKSGAVKSPAPTWAIGMKGSEPK